MVWGGVSKGRGGRGMCRGVRRLRLFVVIGKYRIGLGGYREKLLFFKYFRGE